MKQCKTCGQCKPHNLFYRDKSKPDGLHSQCKECRLAKVSEYRSKNKAILAEKSKLYRSENISACRERERLYSKNNRAAASERSKEFHKKNPSKAKEYNKRYLQKPEIIEIRRENSKIRARRLQAESPIYVLKKNMRSRLHAALRGIGKKKTSKTFECIGCTPSELMEHLSKQMKHGMSWDNYGEWHVDHIIPLASASDEDDMTKLCHYSNLQPLWALENIKKGARLDYGSARASA